MTAWTILLGAALKSTCVLAAAWLLALALRRQSAAARHLVWTACAAALLVLPLFSISLPALRVRTGALTQFAPSITFHTTALGSSEATAHSDPQAARPQGSTHAPWRPGVALIIAVLWAAGTALTLAHMLAAWVVMSRMRRNAGALNDAPLFRSLVEALGIRRTVALLEVPAGGMPLSFGVLRPAVFLPADARQWTEERRRMVMLHELAHVRRGDLATQIVARLAVALFWWNPLAWTAWREFVKERERAADDLVLTCGEPATVYASHLLDIARSMQRVPALVSAAVAMARPSQLEGRLVAILDARTRRHSPAPIAALAAAAMAIVLVAPFAALQAQDKPDAAVLPNVESTIRAAIEQQNHDILDAAAAAYTSVHKYDAAQQLLDNSLTIRAQTAGDHSSAYAIGLMKLGDLEAKRGKVEDAVDFYTRAAALGDTPDTAPGLIYLANRSLGAKDPIGAEGFVERALAAVPSGKLAGRALTVKGNIALANGLTGVAEVDYLHALAQDPPESPEAALTMETYARLLTSQNRTGEADEMAKQAKTIRQAQIDKISTHYTGTAAAGAAVRVGGGVSAPVLTHKQEPEYSADALAGKLTGTVLLGVVVGPDGKAHDITLVRSLGFGLDEKAAEAVSQWNFTPGKKDGTPVSVQATIEVNFRLL
jgi:TonB family protein